MVKTVWSILKSRYVLTLVCFLVWILFMDKDDMISQHHLDDQIAQLSKEKAYYQQQTLDVKKNLSELSSNPLKLEKFAREHYLMKKDNEDVYVIVHEKLPLSRKDSLIKKLKSFF